MLSKISHWWQDMRSSFWFTPATIVVAAVTLAVALIKVNDHYEVHFVEQWPLLFGAGASGSRGLLTAVATSMITVAGVVFSITIVALSLTASQYTSRVLRNFMRDKINQTVLGVFLGIFAYCLVVLRTIRGGDEGAFVPSLAVLGGIILAFVGIAFLIYFIHHIATSMQASIIIATAAAETNATVDRLFPVGSVDEASEKAVDDQIKAFDERPRFVLPAPKTGYVESVDEKALLAVAQELETVLRMECGIGDFVVEGAPLISLAVPGVVNDQDANRLFSAVEIDRQRTIHQDAAFGIRQIVDVALKALSPGINDSTTAVVCVDYLGAILSRIASRVVTPPHRVEHGVLRVIARGPSFDSLLAEALDQIRQNAEGNFAVLTRMLRSLEAVARATTTPHRMALIRDHAELIIAAAQRASSSTRDAACIEACTTPLFEKLAADRKR